MSAPAREAMLDSTIVLLRERGLTGTSVRDVVEHSGAPRGSVYHHFPGGKQQLVEEAVNRAGLAIGAAIDHFEQTGDPRRALDGLIAFFKQLLESSNYNAGCPVAAVAAEADESADHSLSASAAHVFERWRAQIAGTMEREGVPADRSASLSNLMISSIEGALLLSRTSRSSQPLDDVAAELRILIERELP